MDHYNVNCHFSGVVTYSDPNHSLYRVDCYVGPIDSEVWAGGQGSNFTHPNGNNSYGHSSCCSLGEQEEWSGFYNSIDYAYRLVGEDLVLDASDSGTWAPGATV